MTFMENPVCFIVILNLQDRAILENHWCLIVIFNIQDTRQTKALVRSKLSGTTRKQGKPWTAKVGNNDCIKMADESGTLHTTITQRQTLTLVTIEKRGIGKHHDDWKDQWQKIRPRKMLLDGVRGCHVGISSNELTENTRERGLWINKKTYDI